MRSIFGCIALILVVFVAGMPLHSDEVPLEERIQRIRQDVSPDVPSHGAREAIIAKASVLVLTRFHVLKPMLTPERSSRMFNSYFELLDPSKIYFLQSDLEEFRSHEANMWDNMVNIDVDFAFAVYQRFLERVRDWALYSIDALDMPQDFSVEEYMPLDLKTSEIEWCKNADELRDRWRKRIKNTLLVDALQREEAADKVTATAEKEPNASAKPARRSDVRLRNKKLLVSSYQYRREADANEILGYFLNALSCLLDPHTSYMPPATKVDFDIHMSNSLQGAGFVLSQRDFYTTIVEIIPGGPAARDGHLKPGDRILAVAQSEDEEPLDVMDMPLNKVVKQIRGPKGTPVYLTVQPSGSSTEYVLKLIRDEIVLKDSEVQSTIHEIPTQGGTARIVQLYVPSFYCDLKGQRLNPANYRSTTMDAKRLLMAAMAEGRVDGVILDLRGNGGGYMDEACGLCGLFLDGGAVVQAMINGEHDVLSDSDGKNVLYDGPLTVLVDKLSASASEIVAACLQDRGRAVICGEVTHGKGSVQMPLDLVNVNMLNRNPSLLGEEPDGEIKDPGMLKITNGRFYRINGVSTQAIGVTPDIVFPSFIEYMGTGEANLPNVLPSDRISSTKYLRSSALDAAMPMLKARASRYMSSDQNFVRYASEVEQYRLLRERKTLPLEINARRKFRAEEMRCLERLRHYQPVRGDDENKPERLKDEDDEELGDDGPKEDVVLDATLDVMRGLILCYRR